MDCTSDQRLIRSRLRKCGLKRERFHVYATRGKAIFFGMALSEAWKLNILAIE
jgi:hypothetical protein